MPPSQAGQLHLRRAYERHSFRKQKALGAPGLRQPFSMSATTPRQSGSGHLTTYSTALISIPVAQACLSLQDLCRRPYVTRMHTPQPTGMSLSCMDAFSGHGLPRNWVVADIVRLENGMLIEHWDVIQDEATRAESKSGSSQCSAPTLQLRMSVRPCESS